MTMPVRETRSSRLVVQLAPTASPFTHGPQIAATAVSRKLVVLFWHLLTREQDYAFGRPAMTRNKIRKLELLAGAPPQKGRHGIAGGKSKKVFEAERELSLQAEAAYHRLINDWKATGPSKDGAGVTRGRASQKALEGQSARQAKSPKTCSSLGQSPAPRRSIPPKDPIRHLTFIRRSASRPAAHNRRPDRGTRPRPHPRSQARRRCRRAGTWSGHQAS